MALAAILETADTEPVAEPAGETAGETAGEKRGGHPRYLDFARLLRRSMEVRGLNASQLARAVWGETTDNRGYKVARNRDRIGHYLAGISFPEQENLRKIADALGYPLAELQAVKPTSGPVSSTTATNFVAKRNPVFDVQISLVAHKPKYAFIEIKRQIQIETAFKIFELLKAEEENPANTTADATPDPS